MSVFGKFRCILVILLCVFLIACSAAEPVDTVDVESSVPVTESTADTTALAIESTEETAAMDDPDEETQTSLSEETQEASETAVEKISWYETSRLIYHACGAIDGINYTNSMEALEKTLSEGNRLVEVDFLFTSDGHLVCLHEWKNLQNLSGPCSMDRFLSLRMNYRYTTMAASEIIRYMYAYPDMYLIVDTKEKSLPAVVSALLSLCEYDPVVADRFVIQLYGPGEKAQIMELYPFSEDNFLFTAYKFGPGRVSDIRDLCMEEDIRVITLPYGSWSKDTIASFNNEGFYIFEHTLNTQHMAENSFSRGVYGIYTDSLQESDIGSFD